MSSMKNMISYDIANQFNMSYINSNIKHNIPCLVRYTHVICLGWRGGGCAGFTLTGALQHTTR